MKPEVVLAGSEVDRKGVDTIVIPTRIGPCGGILSSWFLRIEASEGADGLGDEREVERNSEARREDRVSISSSSSAVWDRSGVGRAGNDGCSGNARDAVKFRDTFMESDGLLTSGRRRLLWLKLFCRSLISAEMSALRLVSLDLLAGGLVCNTAALPRGVRSTGSSSASLSSVPPQGGGSPLASSRSNSTSPLTSSSCAPSANTCESSGANSTLTRRGVAGYRLRGW